MKQIGTGYFSGSVERISVRWCVENDDERRKCLAMSDAFEKAAMQPKVDCVKTSKDTCVKALQNSEADVFTADGGHMYHNMDILKPIMAEDYGFGK